MIDDRKYTLFEHLSELRSRLLRALIAIALTTGVTFFFVDEIFHFLVRPILPYLPEPKKLIVISPLEQVIAYLKIAVMGGIFAASPIILYQVWRFVAPGLYPNEKKMVLPFVFLGTIFFLGGAAFAFWVFLPITFHFLIGVLPGDVIPQFTVERYYSLVTQFLVAFGLVFELPLILSLLSLAGVVTTKVLKRFRKYAIIGAFVVSAIITPTVDPYTQTLMAMPLILFYEIGILFAWFTERRRQKDAAQQVAPIKVGS